MATYNPDPVPSNAPGVLKAWLANEFRRVAGALNAPMQAPTFGAEPARPRNGMIVYVVDPWATASFGGVVGFYGYEDGAWIKL